MSEWEYAIKEVRLLDKKEDDPEGMEVTGNTLPERANQLRQEGKSSLIQPLSEFGFRLHNQLKELGWDGWEVYHIERLENKRWNEDDTNPFHEVDYRLFAKRRRSE